MPILKNKHGGKRANSGRKKSNIETKVISFRVKKSEADKLKKIIKDIIIKL